MDEKELREILKLLRDAGMDPQLCDTMLPHYLGKVNCGVPLESSGDVEEMIPIPKALLNWGLQYFISAQGDSMKDVGIEEGDRLRVDASRPVKDGDVVVAYLDREITVKTLMSDEEGDRWLVPANDAYDAISLKDKANVKILGVVVANEKQPPRMKAAKALRAIKRAKTATYQPLREDVVDGALKEIGSYVLLKRHWISVYRPLKDRESEVASSYETFCERVKKVLPFHPNLPTVRELQRMDVQSFSKPVRLWDRDDAPVDGKRFEEYLDIAKRFGVMLGKRQTKTR